MASSKEYDQYVKDPTSWNILVVTKTQNDGYDGV